MATCPRCYGPLSDRHTCRPAPRARPVLWRTVMTVVGSGCVALVSMSVWPDLVPGIGLAAGGVVGYAVGSLTAR
ncbi:MAG: hypothetical protein M3Q55_15180 [Acidobacteriota bacterium]|nr:hypothetical protein [Acidobacteriota bacterium]